MKRFALIPLVLLLLAIQGCATKTYGRQEAMTPYERHNLSCQQIDQETAKVQAFVDRVNEESRFSGLDLVALLVDFGIGNKLERDAALKSATLRLDQLRELREAERCPSEPL
jgi:hypothetical protein